MTDEELEQGLREMLNAAPEPPGDLVARAVAGLPARRGPSTRLVWLSLGLAGAAVVLALIVFQPRGLVAPTESPGIAQTSPTPVAMPTPPTGVGGPAEPAPVIAWIRQIGSTRIEGIGSVAFGDNLIYLAGWTQGSMPGKSNAGLEGNEDGVIVAYRLDGSVAWSDQFGSAARDQVTDVAAAGDRVYVVGWSNGLPGQAFAGGGTDAFVRAYRSDGTVLWTRQFGTSGGDFGSPAVAADGTAVYVVGMTQGSFPNQTLSGPQDAFIARFATDGTQTWVRQFGTAAIDEADDVAIGGGGLVITGLTQGAFPGQVLAGGTDPFVRLVDANGSELWTRQFGTASSEGWPNVAATGTDVYANGGTFGTFAGQQSAGSWDAYASRFAASGSAAWLIQFGGSGGDAIYASVADTVGLIAAGGRSQFGMVQRIGSDGGLGWRIDLTGPVSDVARGVAFAGDRIAVGGFVTGTFPGLAAAGGGDLFVALLEPARAPTLAAGSASVSAAEGTTARLSGTFSDPNASDAVTLRATRGTVTQSGTSSGTWSWEVPVGDGPIDSGPVTISATDQTGLSSTVRFDLVATNLPPSAEFGAPTQADEGATFQLALGNTNDPSAADVAAGFEYAFDCGTGMGAFGPTASMECVGTASGQITVGGTIRDKDGGTTTYGAVVTVEAVGDQQPPQVSVPTAEFTRGKALGTVKIPLRVTWSATDGSGVVRTELERSVNGGAFSPVSLATRTSLTVLNKLAPGHRYQYRVRATDSLGNVADWVLGTEFRLVAVASEDALIAYSAGWSSAALSGAYGGSSTSSSTAGATATFTFTGRALAWVGSRGPAYGRAEVRIDGELVATVDARKSQLQLRRILFALRYDTVAAHTVEIRLLDGKLVHVDALLVME